MSDSLAFGGKIRLPPGGGLFTWEALAIEVDASLPDASVAPVV